MADIGVTVVPMSNGKERLALGGGVIVAFICENCARPGVIPSSGIRRRPALPNFAWPFPVQEIAVPCAGRLQPEHFLKALEDGAEAIGVICCEEGNCHHLEGNRRCRRRLEFVGGLVEQAGLEKERLMIFHLPGSAAEDMAAGVGAAPMPRPDMGQKIAVVREAFVARLATIPRNPLGKGDLPDESPNEVDSQDESDE